MLAAERRSTKMAEQTVIVVRNNATAQAAMVELGAWAARLDARIRAFVALRSMVSPPVIYRFSHPVRRALPTTRASVKSWEAYPPACSESGVWEIHVHPRETDARTIVLAALAGLASAMAGPDVKFGPAYSKAAANLGLAPGSSRRGGTSWRNAVVGPESRAEVHRIADSLGALPLGALDASKAQRRMADRNFRKAICPTCGPTSVRLSKKAFEERIFMCGGSRKAPHEPAVVTLGRDNPKSEAA